MPLPGMRVASMNRMSPPTGVHARPVATPGTLVRIATSPSKRGAPRISRTSPVSMRAASIAPSAMRTATLRSTAPISRSRLRHAGFARVVPRDVMQRLVGHRHLLGLQAVRLELAAHQVTPRDLDLLFLGVAGELDDLHAVAQRARDGVELVGRGDEQHLRQVERHVEVVVAEGRVLLRVEHLEQGRCRVAVDAAAELVDLVEHQHRVARAGLAQRLDDAAGHRADVGAAMSADLRLVVHAAEARALELAARARGRCSARARSCPRPAGPRSTGSGCGPRGSACAPRGTRRCAS